MPFPWKELPAAGGFGDINILAIAYNAAQKTAQSHCFGKTNVESTDSAPLVQPKLKSEKGTFSLKTFQFEFAERTHGNQLSQLHVRRFA